MGYAIHQGKKYQYSWIAQVRWMWGNSFYNLALQVMPLDREKVHSQFLVNVDAGHVEALHCPFQLIQLKTKLVIWVPGLKVWASSVQNLRSGFPHLVSSHKAVAINIFQNIVWTRPIAIACSYCLGTLFLVRWRIDFSLPPAHPSLNSNY